MGGSTTCTRCSNFLACAVYLGIRYENKVMYDSLSKVHNKNYEYSHA